MIQTIFFVKKHTKGTFTLERNIFSNENFQFNFIKIKTNKTYRNPRKVQEILSGKYKMIQIEGERGQETEKNIHTQYFHAFFFSTVSVKLKKKVVLFQIHYFIKKIEA